MRESSKNSSVYIHSYTRSWLHLLWTASILRRQLWSWIWCLPPSGLNRGMVLSPGRVVAYWLEQQKMSITPLSPADKVVQLYWVTTLHHWQSYVAVHRTPGRSRGPREEQQDRTRDDYYTRVVITLPWRKTTWVLALAHTWITWVDAGWCKRTFSQFTRHNF